MSARRVGAMAARLAGVALAALMAAAIWAAPASADGIDTKACPPLPSPGDQCIQPWIWPDGRQP